MLGQGVVVQVEVRGFHLLDHAEEELGGLEKDELSWSRGLTLASASAVQVAGILAEWTCC